MANKPILGPWGKNGRTGTDLPYCVGVFLVIRCCVGIIFLIGTKKQQAADNIL